jgi:hypothetical protein
MIEFLVMQVQMGKITVEQIPERLRAFVQERILAIGGDSVIDQS